MAVTVTQLKIRFPEFLNAEATLVQSCLNEAALMVDAEVFGLKTDTAITYLAAHLLAVNPLAEMAKLEQDDGQTTYSTVFDRIKRSVAGGARVV
jgi:hypothetical protein